MARAHGEDGVIAIGAVGLLLVAVLAGIALAALVAYFAVVSQNPASPGEVATRVLEVYGT
jgi:hypothetical protein